MASQVAGYIGQIDPGNGTQYALGSTAYGVCTTAAATAAKTVDMTGFTLTTGATIHVKFTYGNTVSSPTLNVNNTGAKEIRMGGLGTSTSGYIFQLTADSILENAIVGLTYDGTYWIINNGHNIQVYKYKLVTTSVPNITSVGSAPTLGTNISADDITAWTTNTPTSATVSNGVFTIASGAAATLSYTSRSIPNVTSVGSAPTLGTNITAATGAISLDGTGAEIVTNVQPYVVINMTS